MDIDPLYVTSRTVLLDALQALQPHLDAIVLVGAQAVYLRTGPADLPIAPHTTDADLAIDPGTLGPHAAPLDRALDAAGFRLDPRRPGVWLRQVPHTDEAIPVDLLVPSTLAPQAGRRTARLPGQLPALARTVDGLESAIVDHDLMAVTSMDPADERAYTVRVAGAVALLLAKAAKIADRADSPRQRDKDALDVLRLAQNTPTAQLRDRAQLILTDPLVGPAARGHLGLLLELFAPRGHGTDMALAAAAGLIDPGLVRARLRAMVNTLQSS